MENKYLEILNHSLTHSLANSTNANMCFLKRKKSLYKMCFWKICY